MRTTKAPKNCVVQLAASSTNPCYLGEIEAGDRQGVRRIENACRFTERGARRVAAEYTDAKVVIITGIASL